MWVVRFMHGIGDHRIMCEINNILKSLPTSGFPVTLFSAVLRLLGVIETSYTESFLGTYLNSYFEFANPSQRACGVPRKYYDHR